ncbi:tagaturonate reductase [Paenibacillus nasutitermitis]|uniref:Altronate oxidoreductase n=1 Tax=Paenibacillus nasutitermitis TaxID=1652958 RepID=A0A917DMF5_9BACL|nr:tagaturonate reductase [Paenibacillus nasutitermitis]GGD52560.1 altronate oxidoreductase [Paenibacillus nasutitermitis]
MSQTRQGSDAKPLDSQVLNAEESAAFKAMKQSPVRIVQIGEGNFLRGFVDWMVHEMRRQGKYDGAVAVSQPRPSGKAKLEQLQAQDGLYTLIVRGIEQGAPVERIEKIAVFGEFIDPYTQWEALLALAERPELEVLVSNTTEAGLTYQPTEVSLDKPAISYPAKVTALLYRRFLTFGADPAKGLLLLPCELIEGNGDELKRCVLQHSADWQLPEPFMAWVRDHNRFLNSLVDRIVTGYPGEEAAQWQERLGYDDKLLCSAEPYYLWAIEGEAGLESKLPFQAAGLDVVWTGDLKPYQLRKVRILNGAHTLMTPIALLNGVSEVRSALEHPQLGPYIRDAVELEIIPSLASEMAPAETKAYAATVFERFENPYNRHRLLDIAMNSISKFRARLLPSLEGYMSAHNGELPERIVKALAHLLRLYKVRLVEDQFAGERFDGSDYTIRDDRTALEFLAAAWDRYEAGTHDRTQLVEELLDSDLLWGKPLNGIPGLVEAVVEQFKGMKEETT